MLGWLLFSATIIIYDGYMIITGQKTMSNWFWKRLKQYRFLFAFIWFLVTIHLFLKWPYQLEDE